MPSIGKFLILVGITFIVLGIIITYSNYLLRIPYLGRLPGDIFIKKGNFTFYFPLATCILISIILSIFFTLFFRLKK